MLCLPWILVLLFGLAAGCGPAASVREAPRVAVLLADDVRMPKVDGLRAGLTELGLDQVAVTVTVYSAKGDRSQLADLARTLAESGPAVAVAGGGVEAVALKEATAGTKVPVVLLGVASTVKTGLVASLIRPGGNITGVDNQHAELSAKRLELLTKLLPATRTVLAIYDPSVIPGQHGLGVTEEAARRLGLTVHTLEARNRDELTAGLAAVKPGDYDAALLLPGTVLESAASVLAAAFDRLRLPAIGPLEMSGESGLLAAYGTSMANQGRQSARFVAKLLQGQNPALIPVETPDHPELAVDVRVAQRFGLTLSPVGMAFARTLDGTTDGGDLP
jgi:putative ABC transport system substrate-binding protein